MPTAVGHQHHHRSTTKTTHKPFKPRFSSKNALKDRAKGKIERLERGSRKTPHQQVMSKLERRNQARQKRMNNHLAHAKATDVFSGKDGAHRIVVVVPICQNVSPEKAITSLNASLDIEDKVSERGITKIRIDRFKQKLEYVAIQRDILSILDGCKLADYVVLLLSSEEEVDEYGKDIIRCIESQGISTVYTMVQGLDLVEVAKKKQQIQTSLKSFIGHFFPEQEKVFSTDSHQECQNLIRSLCTGTPKGIKWRENRSWMLVEDISWSNDETDIEAAGSVAGEVVLSGTVRGRNMKADRLLQIGDWGAFQIEKIVAEPLDSRRRNEENVMMIDSTAEANIVDSPSSDQDTLDELAPEEVVMEDMIDMAASNAPSEAKGVLLDNLRYYSEDEAEEEDLKPRRLPRGTSKYQSAWYLGDISDSGSDMEDIEDENDDAIMGEVAFTPADGVEGYAQGPEPTEMGESEYPQSEVFMNPDLEDDAEALAEFRAKRNKIRAEEEKEFPDEIELHPSVSAKERLARYRGLKSIRTSPWNQDEDQLHQPEGWSRLLEISDFKSAQSRALNETLVGGVKAGTRVRVHVRNVPLSFKTVAHDPTQNVLGAFSLLRHEQKRTEVNFSITLDSDHPESIRSKEELIVQCGPRRFTVNPLFSQAGNTPNNVHKFERFLHPGRMAVASFTAPLTWGSTPVLYFQRSGHHSSFPSQSANLTADVTSGDELRLIGRGTSLPTAMSNGRIIAKRIVLTGEAYKIHRRVVTIRYMFFNVEDVAWFRALPLWTNRGRQGSIKESLGTHGYFKASFDGKIGMQDAIGVSLYKRVWPRPARPFSSSPR